MSTNYGISITGGTVSSGSMAAGEGAIATSISSASDINSLSDMRAEFASFLSSLRDQQPALEDAGQTVAIAELAAKEMDKDQPNKGSILGLLHLVASGVGSVASLAGSLTALERAASTIL